MCGGVSLAIYINGVSNEFYRAVRGRGVYGLVKELTDSNIVVDILSGSSAGGLNAILLSAALCNRTEFGITAQFWRDKADLDTLLHPTASHTSVLDDRYHEQQLLDALSQLMPDSLAAANVAASLPELDLFITGTDVNGRRTPQVDAAGSTVQIKDHRILFWLKHRQGRKQPFHRYAQEDGSVPASLPADPSKLADANLRSLARLGCITSAFPAAFSPIVVTPPPKNGPFGSVDGRLARWGRLKETTVLIDGGVVDNKPFTSTLEAIFSRLSEKPVQRRLLFVDPAPDEAAELLAQRARSNNASVPVPGFLNVVWGSLSTLPRYDSIAADLKALNEHNARLRAREHLLDSTRALWAGSGPQPPSTLQGAIYRNARHTAFAQMCLEAVFDDEPAPALPDGSTDWPLHTALAAIDANELEQLCSELDVERRLRRMLALTYYQVPPGAGARPGSVWLRLRRRGAPEEIELDEAAYGLINSQIELLIIVRARLQKALATLNSDGWAARALQTQPQEFWSRLVATLREALRGTARPSSFDSVAQLSTANGSASFRQLLTGAELTQLAELPANAATQSFTLADSDSFESSFLQVANASLHRTYADFEAEDSVALPLELASGLREKDVVESARISPFDARLGLSAYEGQKLCGIQLANFGGFLKKSWRSNDNLWGRLDATCVLLETLLDPARLAQPLVLEKLRGLTTLSDRVDELFPLSSARSKMKLKRWLTKLTSEGEQQAAIAELKSSMLEELVMAAHLEILHQDLIQVLEDDLAEASAAGRLGMGRRRAKARLEEARELLVPNRGDELAAWFLGTYAVPRETFKRDVPLTSKIALGFRFATATLQATLGSHDDVASAANRS